MSGAFTRRSAIARQWRYGASKSRGRRLWTWWTTHARCPHAHSSSSRHSLWLHDRRKKERPIFQLRTRIKWSRFAGPFQQIIREAAAGLRVGVELMGDPGLLYCVAVDHGPMEGGSDEDAFHIAGRRFAPRIRDYRSGGHDLPEEAMSCVR